MIGMRIFEANALHLITQFDLKSLDADDCRYYADSLHGCQVELNYLHRLWLRFPDVELKADLRESLMMLRRLEIHFANRRKAIDEYWNNYSYAKQYAQDMGMRP